MVTALKLLSLPFFFVLPWLLIKVNGREMFVQQTLFTQPLLVGILLLPGFVVFLWWVFRGLRRPG